MNRKGLRQMVAGVALLLAGIGLGWFASRGKPVTPDLAVPPREDRESAALPFDPVAAMKSPAAAREFEQLPSSARKKLEDLIRRFGASDDAVGKMEILEQIDAGPHGREFLTLAREVLADPGAEADVRARVLEMLAGNTSAEILPLLGLLRRSESAEERRLAVLAAARVRSPETGDFIAGFFSDPGKTVRFAALEVSLLQPRDSRNALLVRAMHGEQGDIGLAGLAELELEASPVAVDTIFRGLDSPNGEVRAEALRSASFLLDEDFENRAAAASWWSANRHRFDRNLNRSE